MVKKEKNKATSSQIALGGLFSALCLIAMFLAGVVPFGTYALPCLAGIMIIPVMVENGTKIAWMVYASVSLLSIFIVTDPEASMMFILLLGYYPILKRVIERLGNKLLAYIVKQLLFNITIVGGYAIFVYIIGFDYFFGEAGGLAKYVIGILIFGGNFVFLIYDRLLTICFALYKNKIRKKLVRK